MYQRFFYLKLINVENKINMQKKKQKYLLVNHHNSNK